MAKVDEEEAHCEKTSEIEQICPRNPVGVQLLSPSLQAQLFPATSFKPPIIHEEALSLSQHHLKTHGLEPEQAASLPPIAFDLPPLQGKDLAQHFWNLGRQAAQPWLAMAHGLAATTLHETLPAGVTCEPGSSTHEHDADENFLSAHDWLELDQSIRGEFRPRPPQWLKRPGWVRYPVLTSRDGQAHALGDGESVEYPSVDDGALVFDVECMVEEGPYAVMATAAGPKAWYAWLSPWLLQKGQRCSEKDHLIPFGPSEGADKRPARLLIGHNVGFDRARVRDEYTLDRSNIRWLDTMSLHVATHGISSPQRGAWVKHSKSRSLEKMLEKDDVEEAKKSVIMAILGGVEVDEDLLAELDLDELVRDAQEPTSMPFTGDMDAGNSNSPSLLWQDITSSNSLAEVAKLHCNINLSKATRDVFVDGTPRDQIVDRLDELLTYCASDTLVTHKVFSKVWPAFAKNCPNPVTAAGVLGLGSTILPVDDEWVEYIKRCEDHYESALREVRDTLISLAEQLRVQGTQNVTWEETMQAMEVHRGPEAEHQGEIPNTMDEMEKREIERLRPTLWWENDAWANQLDWTPKKPKKIKATAQDPDAPGNEELIPRWYRDKVLRSPSGVGRSMAITPILLRLHRGEQPILKREDGKWVVQGTSEVDDEDLKGSPLRQAYLKRPEAAKLRSVLGKPGTAALEALRENGNDDTIRASLREAAEALVVWAQQNQDEVRNDSQLKTLDWTGVEAPEERQSVNADIGEGDASPAHPREWWPKWYWDLIKPGTGQLEVTIRSKVAPLLLRLTWQRCPLHHSREHGWTFRYDPQSKVPLYTRQKPLKFKTPADQAFRADISRTVEERLADVARNATSKNGDIIDPASITPVYYKVPHAAGDNSNVGSPFAKGFIPLFEKGTLQSEHPDERGRLAAKRALETNARCSYWIGVRDRVEKQMVVWDGQGGSQMMFQPGASGARQDDESERMRRKGIILPQVVPMGTVTRRAIEKTWLTASNAKVNRVGSELKAMVKAPPGWSIVGADVDSQELWICSVIGDAQFGFHGATAVGWMTLEGSKSLGTDLHSKTAQILGTGRNQAKVFNYSRIYGAGIRHSSQLLLKATPDMSSEEAMRKAKELYASTKGKNTYSNDFFGRRFWYGGTESFVFNKLEDIALGEQPKTPALDCGVTAALTRKYLPNAKPLSKFGKGGSSSAKGGQDYMPSRINWVVQSSGVDYLHLLITAMEYLISKYDLRARFMISVHDEVRYLARDEDAQRVALALQIANLWTRAMFAHKLQMESLPQGVGFFAQVDIDKVLRKETDDPCVTPSQPNPVPFGKAYDIGATLSLTHGGSLHRDGHNMHDDIETSRVTENEPRRAVPGREIPELSIPQYSASQQNHRSLGVRGLRFLQAQASNDINEIAALEERLQVLERDGGYKSSASKMSSYGDTTRGKFATTSPFNASRRSTSGGHNRPTSPSSSGFHTSVAQGMLPFPLQDIVDHFPARPGKLRVPFFRTKEHRMLMRWEIYRQLLRQCDAELFPNIYIAIRKVTRAQRYNTSPRQTKSLEEHARSLLTRLAHLQQGDEDAKHALAKHDKQIARKYHKRVWKNIESRYLLSEEDARMPQPRLSGALLAPSLYNPPLLRFKPVQPDHITMSIAKRRRAREGRLERFTDSSERLKMMEDEAKFWSQLRPSSPWSSQFGSAHSWTQEINRSERALLSESNARDVARSKMVFSTHMLRTAKLARRAKLRSRLRRKQFLAREAEMPSHDGKDED